METTLPDEELRLWLERHLDDEGITMNRLSRTTHTGVSKLALQAYVDGVYFLPTEAGGLGVRREKSTVETRIRKYRDRVEGYGVLADALVF